MVWREVGGCWERLQAVWRGRKLLGELGEHWKAFRLTLGTPPRIGILLQLQIHERYKSKSYIFLPTRPSPTSGRFSILSFQPGFISRRATEPLSITFSETDEPKRKVNNIS